MMALRVRDAYESAFRLSNASKNIRSYLTRNEKAGDRTEFLPRDFRKAKIEFSCDCEITVARTAWYSQIIKRPAASGRIIVPAADKHSYVM
jgi:hypothetical protein